MSKDNTLPKELQKRIVQEAMKKYSPARQGPYIDGATEWAQKWYDQAQENNRIEVSRINREREYERQLRELQHEHEALQRWKEEAKALLNPIFEYAQDHPDMKLGGSMIEFVLNRCKEYDKLKAENEGIRHQYQITEKSSTLLHDRLISLDLEYKALKDKAEKMADLLQYIRNNSRLSLFAKAEIDGVLSSYNSQTNNQNNG